MVNYVTYQEITTQQMFGLLVIGGRCEDQECRQYIRQKLVNGLRTIDTEQCQHPSRGEGDNKRGGCAENIQSPDTETGATGDPAECQK